MENSEHSTFNIQHQAPDATRAVRRFDVGSSMFNVQCFF